MSRKAKHQRTAPPAGPLCLLTDAGFPGYVAEIFRSLRIKVLLNLPKDGPLTPETLY